MYIHEAFPLEADRGLIANFAADPLDGFVWAQIVFDYQISPGKNHSVACISLFSYGNGKVNKIEGVPDVNWDMTRKNKGFKIDLENNLYYEITDQYNRVLRRFYIDQGRSKVTRIETHSHVEVPIEVNDQDELVAGPIPGQKEWEEWDVLLKAASYYYMNIKKGAFVKKVLQRQKDKERYFYMEMMRHFPVVNEGVRTLGVRAFEQEESNAFVFDVYGNLKYYTLPEEPDGCCVDCSECLAAFYTRKKIFFIDLD